MADAALTASGEPHGPETGKSLRCAPVSSPLALALAFAMAHGLATPLGSFPFACQSTAAHVRACFKRGQRRPGRIAATGGRQCERACMQPTGPCTGDRCTQLLFFTETCGTQGCGRSVCRWPCLLRLAKLDASVGTCAARAAWHGGRQCSGVLLVSRRASVKPSRAIVSTARQGLCTGYLGPCTLRDSSCSAMGA